MEGVYKSKFTIFLTLLILIDNICRAQNPLIETENSVNDERITIPVRRAPHIKIELNFPKSNKNNGESGDSELSGLISKTIRDTIHEELLNLNLAPPKSECEDIAYVPIASNSLEIQVRAPKDFRIILAGDALTYLYEINLGVLDNTKSIIISASEMLAAADTPGILSAEHFRGFWISWDNGGLLVGRQGESEPFLEWQSEEIVPVEFLAICAGSGSWILGKPEVDGVDGRRRHKVPPKEVCWKEVTDEELPDGAFVGGKEGPTSSYVARANYAGGLIPGKHLGRMIITYEGREVIVPKHEVLCDFDGKWETSSGKNIPPNALAAGRTAQGEMLYVGRVLSYGELVVGRVQPSKGGLLIAQNGTEWKFNNYEILVQ